MNDIRILLAAGVAGATLAGSGLAEAQAIAPAADALPAAATPAEAITGGKLLLDLRARYEFVDEQKTAVLTDNAEAYTVRTLLGWETAPWEGLQALVEGKAVRLLGPERFAVNPPGATTPPMNGADKARYPLVDDPETTELNRLQLTWKPNAAFDITGGRQVILIDDQRFIGDVGWRQDQQTFDAVRADLKWTDLRLFYAYVTHVNRVLGTARDWDSASHLVNMVWAPGSALQLEGFLYALDFRNSAANTSLTKGLKASGAYHAGAYRFAYHATYARQSDYRRATAPYGLDYWGLDASASAGTVTGKVDWELLQGDGARGFTTPLATTHAFQGWSDAFVQPLGGAKGFGDGLKDLNFTLDFKPSGGGSHFGKPDLLVCYHDFKDDRTGAELGHEWDAQLQAALTAKLGAALKFATFDRAASVPAGTAQPPPSRTKIWFTLEYRL